MNCVARPIAAAVLAAGLLAGCAIGPSYERPELPAAETFRGQEASETTSIADLPWWEVFQDPALGALIRETLERNHDLRAAAARVEQARYSAAVARGELFPAVDYRVGATTTNDASRGPPTPSESGGDDSFLGAINLAWEIDVWGRLRRANESARAQLFATDAFRRGVVLSLVSGVAQRYFELRELDLELEIARSTVTTFEETRDIFERQFRGGVASQLDPLRAEAARAQAAATIPDLERRIVAKENELAVLAGRTPGPIERGATLVEQTLPPEVPAGLPADLVARRPDLIEAEQTLVAQNAQIGVALAEFFPRIGLTAFAGGVSPELSDLVNSGTGLWRATGIGVGPLFSFGRNLYGYRAQQAATEEALVQYEQATLVAFQEVSDALTARQKLEGVRAEQEKAVAALRDALRIARVRYLGGLATYLEVLDAQQQLFPAENDLARTRRDQLLAIVALYRTLGGGWSIQPEPPDVPQPIAP